LGLRKQLMGMSREYLKNPKVQYFKYLQKILDMSTSSNVSKKDVKSYVDKWAKE